MAGSPPSCVSGVARGAAERSPPLSLRLPLPPLLHVALRPDPSAACSRLKRFFCGGAIPDAMRASPPPSRPQTRTENTAPRPPAATDHCLWPAHRPHRRTAPPCAAHSSTQPSAHSQTSPHGHKAPPAPRRHNPVHTCTTPHRRSPTHAATLPPTNNCTQTHHSTQTPHHSVPPRPRSTFTS